MDCYCARDREFSDSVLLCPKHIYKKLGINSFQEIKKKVLKPINFDNYDDKFKIKSVVKSEYLENTSYHMITIMINVISLDNKICVQMNTSNNNVPYSGSICYKGISNYYTIKNEDNVWRIEFVNNRKYPNLDPIKKHLKDIILQNHDNNLLLEPVRRQDK